MAHNDLRDFVERCRTARTDLSLDPQLAETVTMRRLGNNAALCERLLGYVISREKTGVFSQPADFPDGRLPRPGEYAVLSDFDGRPRALIRYEECAVLPFHAVGPEHVAIETAPMRNLEKFRAFHRSYWTPILEARGERFTEDLPLVFQRFTCLYPPAAQGEQRMLTLYGPARSRASRVVWMLEECGIAFQHEDLTKYATMDEKAAAVKKIYALGKVPFIVDGDVQLAESMAINVYLARKYGKQLWPAGEADQAKALQWSFFGVTEVDPPMVQLMIERMFRKEADRSVENEKKNAEQIKRPLSYLNEYLGSRQYLVGNCFTVADLNMACIFSMANGAKVGLDEYPNVKAWLDRCRDRPAHQKATAAK